MNLLNLDWSKILLKKKANRKNREGRSGRVTPSSDQGANRTAVPTPQWSPAYKGRKRTARPPGAVLFTSRHVAGRASRVTLAGQERYSPSFSRATVPGATRTATRNRPKNKKKILFFFCFCFCFWFPIIHSDLFNYFCIYWMVGCISASFNRNSRDLFGPKWSLSAVMKSDNGAVVTLVE